MYRFLLNIPFDQIARSVNLTKIIRPHKSDIGLRGRNIIPITLCYKRLIILNILSLLIGIASKNLRGSYGVIQTDRSPYIVEEKMQMWGNRFDQIETQMMEKNSLLVETLLLS
jgi:hypothetical protein